MPRTVSIGCQDYEKLRMRNNFYIDKTAFIKEWWETDDEVTLITRPRRFGKTLTMSMLEKFFSVEYADRDDLFEGLNIWKEEKYHKLQGTYPVIMISFADIKETSFAQTRKAICRVIKALYNRFDFLLKGDVLNESEKNDFREISVDMEDNVFSFSLKMLSCYLSRYYNQKVILLLDEYDTPMQEAYVNGFWEEMASLSRRLFNATFKTNPYMERAVMTGITRISRESMFSDLNNLKVVTVTSEEYSDCFGFTEREVFAALDEFCMLEQSKEIKRWYDGFIFGKCRDIYNPWSILNFLDTGKAKAYWVNTSSNSLVGKLVREGSPRIKMIMEQLLQGKTFCIFLDEQIVFNQLDRGDEAVWSLLLASGYLKAVHSVFKPERMEMEYELALTNLEVHCMFLQMVREWFGGCREVHNAFLQAMLSDDLDGMNEFINEISAELFSSFDTGKKPSEKAQPERFYHGFVLGMLVELQDRYTVSPNRESGLGRYDVMLEPKKASDPAYIIEFKVVHAKRKENLEDGVQAALKQIEEKQYETALLQRGILPERIRKYGFAFEGSRVLIGKTIS